MELPDALRELYKPTVIDIQLIKINEFSEAIRQVYKITMNT